jgi:hypothetical protein
MRESRCLQSESRESIPNTKPEILAVAVVAPASEQALLDLQADLDEQFEVMEAHLIPEEA